MSEEIELNINQPTDLNCLVPTDRASTSMLPPHARAGQSVAINLPVAETQEIFVDHRDVSSYRFLSDMYSGDGGVSGQTGDGKNRSRTLSLNNFGSIGCTVGDVYSYLIPNPTENFYKTRVRSSDYTNYFRRYIDSKYQAVFKIPPPTIVTVGDKVIENHPYLNYVNDVNGAGMSKDELNQNLMASVYTDEDAFLVSDKSDNDVMRTYIQTASSVVDYNTDMFGNLIAITFINELPNGKFVMNAWETDKVTVSYSDDGEKWTESIERSITHMPIMAVFAGARKNMYDYLPKPKSYSVASKVLNIYQSESKVDYVIDKQAHDYLWTTGIVEGMRSGIDNITQIDGSDGATLGVVSPDATKVTVQIARINQKQDALFEMMSEGGVSVTRGSMTPESGYSKEFTFTPFNDALLHTTMILKRVDKFLVEEWKHYNGGGTFDATTHYKVSFTPKPKTSLGDMITSLEVMESHGLITNAKTLMKSIVTENYGDDVVTTILRQEIEDSTAFGVKETIVDTAVNVSNE